VIAWLTGTCGVNTQSIADCQLRLYRDNEGIGVVFPVIDPSSSRVTDLWLQRIDRHPFAEFRLSQKPPATVPCPGFTQCPLSAWG